MLNEAINGGAWCPENNIGPGIYEWLQIDLQTLHKIVAVETQGRFAYGEVSERISERVMSN